MGIKRAPDKEVYLVPREGSPGPENEVFVVRKKWGGIT